MSRVGLFSMLGAEAHCIADAAQCVNKRGAYRIVASKH